MDYNEEELLLLREAEVDDLDRAIKMGIDSLIDINYDKEPLLLATCSYLKRVLLEVARIKGFKVDDEAREEFPEKIPNEKLVGLDVETVNDPDKMYNYVNYVFENCGDLDSVEEACSDISTIILPTEKYYLEKRNMLSVAFDSLIDCIKTNGNCDDTFIVEYGQIDLSTGNFNSLKTGKIDEQLINDLLKFVNTYRELLPRKLIDSDIMSTLSSVHWKIDETRQKLKLSSYHNNEEFMHDLSVLMEHDPEQRTYFYHGTKCLEDTETIFEYGLGLSRKNIYTTAYDEFDADTLLLYKRGLLDEVGRDAVVVIDAPKGENIIENNPYKDTMPFCPSGMQGLNAEPDYYIDTKHIIGYVDKKNKKIVLNPKYKDYEEVKERMESETKIR